MKRNVENSRVRKGLGFRRLTIKNGLRPVGQRPAPVFLKNLAKPRRRMREKIGADLNVSQRIGWAQIAGFQQNEIRQLGPAVLARPPELDLGMIGLARRYAEGGAVEVRGVGN